MATQIQIGKDKLVFSKVSNFANCEITPTPTPTPACLTVNLDTQITCDEYQVADAYRSSSSNKLLDAMVSTDNSILMCGLSVCGSVLSTSSVSESVIAKSKIQSTIEDSVAKEVFSLDETFSTNGKINEAFYDTNNFKITSKFNCMISQVASGQNRIIVGGDSNNKPLIARYLLSSGNADRTFGFNTGAVILDTISNNTIRLINVFGLSLQTDNKIIVFCNAYDTVNKHSLCVIVRLTNSGLIDSTFNQNNGFISLRSPLSEFDGNKITGIKIKNYNNIVYLILECFSSIRKNTIIVAKYSLNDSSLDVNFGIDGFAHINIDDKDTYYQNLFVHKNVLYIIANSKNHKLHVIPYNLNGTINSNRKTLEITNQVFPIRESGNNDTGFLTVNFMNLPCDEIIVDDNIVIPVNVNILSNSLNTIGPNNNSAFHWFEKPALVQSSIEYNALQYRDCSILPCDRQPQDSYGTLVIDKQKIKKYYTPSRILYGFIALSDDITSAAPIKLDRFDNLVPHNILKAVLLLKNQYVAVGYAGDNFYSSMSLKTINFAPDSSSLGPSESDMRDFIDFDDSCAFASATEEFVVEECPCAPTATPTPTPTPIFPTSDVYLGNITSGCTGDIPILKVTWIKNVNDLIGSYVLRVVRNSTDKPEILAAAFDIARNTTSGDIVLELDALPPDLNNKTCIASIIDSVGEVVHSKIFVLSISNCQQ